MTRQLLLMLEDDAERLARFRSVVVRLGLELVVWRDAHRMLAEYEALLPSAALVSLDHDLEPEGNDGPGDGLDVARHLAELAPVCPVIVHTSNGVRGDAMVGELELGGWTFRRVSPIGDDWIEVDWFVAVRRLLKRKQ